MREAQLITADGEFQGGFELPSVAVRADDVGGDAAREGGGAYDGTEYGVVAVIGCQSSGKSTLLNAVFGTNFPVLDTVKHGRRRTTIGVWGAMRDQDGVPVVLFDVEGSDSRDRGEGQHSFESRTALFSVALADVVIVNMWMHDVGRHVAANYELFELIFSQSLRVTGRSRHTDQRKTKIIIVVRDFDDEVVADPADISKLLLGDLEEIWTSLLSNKKSTPRRLSSMFDISIATLPHPTYFQDQFAKAVEDFRNKLGPWGTKAMPLSALEEYAKSVWESIEANTSGSGWSLDLPAHVELVQQMHCSDAKQEAIDAVEDDFLTLRYSLEVAWREPVKDYTFRCEQIRRRAMEEYSKRCSDVARRCRVYEVKKMELEMALMMRIQEDRVLHLDTGSNRAFRNFEMELEGMVSGVSDLDRRLKRQRDQLLKDYESFVRGSLLEGETNGSEIVAARSSALQTRMDNLVRDRKRMDELVLGPHYERKKPFWRNPRAWRDAGIALLLRGAVLAFNYWQATRQLNAQRNKYLEREREEPTGRPTF